MKKRVLLALAATMAITCMVACGAKEGEATAAEVSSSAESVTEAEEVTEDITEDANETADEEASEISEEEADSEEITENTEEESSEENAVALEDNAYFYDNETDTIFELEDAVGSFVSVGHMTVGYVKLNNGSIIDTEDDTVYTYSYDGEKIAFDDFCGNSYELQAVTRDELLEIIPEFNERVTALDLPVEVSIELK